MSTNNPDDAVIIAIDAGTTGVRAFAVDLNGHPVDMSYREFTQFFPEPGLVEHDAEEIWNATVTVVRELAERLERTVAAFGITNQRETAVAWDARSSKPRCRAIVWQDRRTSQRCDELREAGYLNQIRSSTGLVLDPYFSATKFEWLLRHGGISADPDLRLGTIDSWLVWKLTAGERHVTDPSNASRTMLLDINTLQWSEGLCELFGVPIASLPHVFDSAGEFGVTADGIGVPAGVPVSGIAGDQQAALFGQACTRPGMAKNTYGTGSFVLMNIGEEVPPPSDGLLTTVAWRLPHSMLEEGTSAIQRSDLDDVVHYALEGAIFVTGAAVQWLRDGINIIDSASEVGALAESVDEASGVVFVPAFTGLGSPYWDPYARGTILGITRGVGRAHLARAVVESMAFQTRDVVEAMRAVASSELDELRVDGGAAVMDLLLQVQADQLGVRVLRSAVAETTALGAAYLAGLGAGLWSTLSEVGERWRADAIFKPSAEGESVDGPYAQWRRGVERSRSWAHD